MRRGLATILCATALLVGPSGASRVRADPPTAATTAAADVLRGDGRALRRAETRGEALSRVCSLGTESLDAIRTRVAQIRGERPSSDAGYAALGQFAETAGASSQSDGRDILPGIVAYPADRFSVVHATVAERYCLVRSLERMGTAEALVVAGQILTFDMRAFRWQARHVVRRADKRAAAMLIRAASHPNGEVDLWADWGFATLGIRDSGDTVQGQSEESLIEVLRAYSAMRHIGGMPVVGSFVDDARISVRETARASMALYGENAIWELRRLFTTRVGEDPGNRSWQLLARELYRRLDERREAPLRDRSTRALTALAAGRLDEAITLADGLVVEAPLAAATRRVAPVYVALARARAARGEMAEAASALARAVRLGAHESDPGVMELDRELRDARLAERGIVESSERPEATLLGTDSTGKLLERRTLARYGVVLGWMLLSGSFLIALARRTALTTRDGLRAAARVYRERERERVERVLAAWRTNLGRASVGASRRLGEVRAALVGRVASFEVTLPTFDLGRSAAIARASAQAVHARMGRMSDMAASAAAQVGALANAARAEQEHTQAAPTVTTPRRETSATHTPESHGPVHEARPGAAPRQSQRPSQQTASSTPRACQPTTPLEVSHARKNRPTRRAVADAELFSAPRRTRDISKSG